MHCWLRVISLPAALCRSVALPGNHHFNGDSARLAGQILDFRGV